MFTGTTHSFYSTFVVKNYYYQYKLSYLIFGASWVLVSRQHQILNSTTNFLQRYPIMQTIEHLHCFIEIDEDHAKIN